VTAPKEMFLPGNRKEWTSMVRPPAGYRLEAAIGATYSLDFTALTAVLLASLDQQSDQTNWDEHAKLLEAITRLGDRVHVIVNRGQIPADVRQSNSNKMFALFDRMVTQVRHKHGNFHPKVWVLKYTARQALDTEEHKDGRAKSSASDAIYRLICTSRNLTLASTWEAVVCIEGSIRRESDSASVQMGRSVAAFFEVVFDAGEPIPGAFRTLGKELGRVSFSTEGSKAVQSCEFLWQWPGLKGLDQQVESGGKTALMVSPFVRAGFLRWLAKRFINVIVVSRQEELDALWGSIQSLIRPENLWVVKAADGDEGPESVPSLDLHAKILLCEYARSKGAEVRTEAWIGSANASGSAWGLIPTAKRMNCEAMVRFRPAIRPEQFLDQFAYRERRGTDQEEDFVLNGWIEQYQRREIEELNADEQADESLEHVSVEIAGLDLRARFKGGPNSMVMTLDSTDREMWAALFATHQGILFEVCPMGIADGRPFHDLKDLATRGVQFEGLSMAQVGAFILIQLTHIATKRTKRFVIKAATEMDNEFWDERRVAFLRENLDAKDFRTILGSILFGGSLRSEPVPGGGIDKGGPTKRPERRASSLLDDFNVEDVLHSCTEDSSRIDEIDRLLKTFEKTEHIDASFREFWTNFREAIGIVKKEAV
jgi:hypothetical protein